MAVVRGDSNKIVIGKASNIQDGAVIHVTGAYDNKYLPFAYYY